MGPYETGLSIQTFINLAGDSPRPHESIALASFEEQKRKGEVVRECEPEQHGLFNRVCLEQVETLELVQGAPEPYRVVYSYFWGQDDMNVFVVMVFGAPERNWSEVAEIYNVMSAFELIDMNRFAE